LSDLYLDLKHRIPVVGEWVEIGREEMQRAQKRLGLSDERLARLIPVSEKTWRRWKARGAIPVQWLARAAEALDLELVRAEPVRVAQPGAVPADALLESLAVLVDLTRELAETTQEILSSLRRIEQAMPLLAPAPDAATALDPASAPGAPPALRARRRAG
jgi:DNA-binding transcriptional regulator YiaG